MGTSSIKLLRSPADILPMAWNIEDLLQRRSDLSTFLVHFTRDVGGVSSRDNLLSILGESTIRARHAFGMGKNTALTDERFQASQRVACFTETPIEHAWMMCADIAGRASRLGHHGIAFTKIWARFNHANPVWYLDMSPRGGADWLTVPINTLRAEALKSAEEEYRSLAEYPIARILPFLEQMFTTCESRKEFWWEREWRHVGDMHFQWTDAVAIFAPHGEHAELRSAMNEMGQPGTSTPPLLDPNWGLERMISALRAIPPNQAGPLPL